MTPWVRLERLLARGAEHSAPPRTGRVGAALALITELTDDLELVYTRRRDDLTNHPGQISFPGGRVEPGETIAAAALREAAEEVGLQRDTVTVLGTLRPFYIPPSRYWLQIVVARWERPHPLVAQEAEVGEILAVPLGVLTDASRWRTVRLSASGWSWAWQLDERHLLWGATAMVTASLLDALAPDWHGGRQPADLAPEGLVQPWLADRETARASAPPRLRARPSRWSGDMNSASWDGAPVPERLDAVGHATAEAALELAGERPGPVLVLAGRGGNGAAGLAVARVLAARGRRVEVVTAGAPAGRAASAAVAADGARGAAAVVPACGAQADLGAGGPVQPADHPGTRSFDGHLPPAAVVVDALVGGGLHGPLRGAERAMLLELRRQFVPVLSLDVPSGLHGTDGLVGDTFTADVTLALGGPRTGLFHRGLAPFVGDLYTITEDGSLTRVLRRPTGEPHE